MRALSILVMVLLLAGCKSEQANPERDFKQVEITDVFAIIDEWARPASSGANTAAYFELQNGLSTADTLLNVYSDAAAGVEVHESFIDERGLAGMRHQAEVPIPSGSSVTLEPGGIHVMLLQLKDDLIEGDSIKVNLEFKQQGILTLNIPVKSNN